MTVTLRGRSAAYDVRLRFSGPSPVVADAAPARFQRGRTVEKYGHVMDPFILFAGAVIVVFLGGVIVFDALDSSLSFAQAVVGILFIGSGAALGVAAFEANTPRWSSPDQVLAYAKERPGEIHEIRISVDFLARDHRVKPAVVDELVGDDPDACRTVKSVFVCRDSDGRKLLLQYDPGADSADDVALLSTTKELSERARRDGGGLVRIQIDRPNLPVSAREAVAVAALTEIYGADWRTAQACRTVEGIGICRNEDNTILTLMAARPAGA